MLNKYPTTESIIASFDDCENKSKCDCFNNNPKIICGDVRMCRLIHYYKQEIDRISDDYEEEIYFLRERIELEKDVR